MRKKLPSHQALEFAKKLNEYIRKKGFTPDMLAKKLEMGDNTIEKWVTGTWPRTDLLAKVCKELDCSMDYLLDRTNNPKSHKGKIEFDLRNIKNFILELDDLKETYGDMLKVILDELNSMDSSQAERRDQRRGNKFMLVSILKNVISEK